MARAPDQPVILPAGLLDADALLCLQNAAFPEQPWSRRDIDTLLGSPGTIAFQAARRSNGDLAPRGYILARIAADEVEVLSLGILGPARRNGIATRLLMRVLEKAGDAGCRRACLEVAADNAPAIALYRVAGFSAVGRRRGYYARPDGRHIDALVLARDLP